MTFDKQRGEYELKQLSMSHSFALKMASIICWAVVTCVIVLGICTVAVLTPIIIGIIAVIAIILGTITFSATRSACM